VGPPAGILLVGGRSRRMGSDKAWLTWGGETLLAHVARPLAAGTGGPLVVVARGGQELPPLPPGAMRVDDTVADEGPLRGLATGLAATAERGAKVAVAATVDAPFLAPALVTSLARVLATDEAAQAAAVDSAGCLPPFPAAYRTSLASTAEELLARGERRARSLLAAIPVRRITAAELLTDPGIAAQDPRMRSLEDLDDRLAYERTRPQPR